MKLRIHAQIRAKEHYGLDLEISDVSRMADDCRDGRGMLLRRDTVEGAGDRYMVIHKGVAVIVVYSAALHKVKTVLPLNVSGGSHPKRKQKDRGPAKSNIKRNPRSTRYIPEIDLEDA